MEYEWRVLKDIGRPQSLGKFCSHLGRDRIGSGSGDKTVKIWNVSDVVRVADDESKGEERNNNKKKYTIGIQNAMMLNRMIDTDRIQKLHIFQYVVRNSTFNVSDLNNIGLSLQTTFSSDLTFEDFVTELAVEIIDEIANDYDTFFIIDKAREEYRKRVVDRIVNRKTMYNATMVNAVYTVDKARRLATIKLVDYFQEKVEGAVDIHYSRAISR